METLRTQTETKAIKQHICNFCGEKIIVNEKYMKSTHINDGLIYDWKSHKYCSKLASRLNMYKEAYDGVTQDFFMESVSEEHYSILVGQMSKEDRNKYNDMLIQLRGVNFRTKLWFVIRHYNKIDKI